MKLHVGNLPKNISSEQLNEIVKPFGTVESAEVVTDRKSGESRGYGFVVFTKAEEASAAVAGLNGKDFDGQAIKVTEAHAPKDRPTA